MSTAQLTIFMCASTQGSKFKQRSKEPQSTNEPYQDLPQVASQLAIYVLLSIGNLHVHIVVSGDQVTFVLHAPLQLHHNRFSSETIQKWFGVQRHSLGR